MNKLEIAKKISLHSGMDPIGPHSTVNQVGEFAKLIEWIDATYLDILGLHEDWQFLHSSFDFQTTAGKQKYTPAEAGLPDFKNWLVDDVRTYKQIESEQDIWFCDWGYFKRVYLFGSARVQTGIPNQFTVMPDRSIMIWPIPDDKYHINGWYFKAGTPMVNDEDVPVFKEEYHWIIVWRALTFYGADYVEADKYQHGVNEYERIKGRMEFNELPQFTRGEPLA